MLKLGTARHHDGLLRGIDNMEDIGCFALTELGFGNNAVEMQVTVQCVVLRYGLKTPGDSLNCSSMTKCRMP